MNKLKTTNKKNMIVRNKNLHFYLSKEMILVKLSFHSPLTKTVDISSQFRNSTLVKIK